MKEDIWCTLLTLNPPSQDAANQASHVVGFLSPMRAVARTSPMLRTNAHVVVLCPEDMLYPDPKP